MTLAALEDHEALLLSRSGDRWAALADDLNTLASGSAVSVVSSGLTRLADVRGAVAESRGRHTNGETVFVNAGKGCAVKRLLYLQLHRLHARRTPPPVLFFGFQIPKTVWSNQINIIPGSMRGMANLMQMLG